MPERILSIALSKNSLGIAILEGQHLISLEAHVFETTPAEHISGPIYRCIEHFKPSAAAIQNSSSHSPEMHTAALGALRATNTPAQEISEGEIFASFGEPPIENRDELRRVVRVLFPQIPAGRMVLACLDAVATGLCFGTKRLLNINQQQT